MIMMLGLHDDDDIDGGNDDGDGFDVDCNDNMNDSSGGL